MASWNRVTAGDTLYDVRKQRLGLRSELCVWPVAVISMDSVTETAQCSWNHNKPRRYTRKQLEKLRVMRPGSKKNGQGAKR